VNVGFKPSGPQRTGHFLDSVVFWVVTLCGLETV
jgi:hypothetical protein